MKGPAISRPLRVLINIVIVIAVVGGLAGGAVATYNWYEHNFDGTPQSAVTIKKEGGATDPAKSTATGKVNAALQLISTPVKPGDDASMHLRVDAGITCTVKVEYGSGASKVEASDPGLVEKTADAFGTIGWYWTVPASAPKGAAKAVATCHNAKNTTSVTGDFTVAG